MKVTIVKGNHDRENTLGVWKDYTTEDAAAVTENVVKAIEPQQ